MFDPQVIRQDFPILDRQVRDGVPLVYLDNAATSQTPRQVVEAMSQYYYHHKANVHRGVHQLSDESTQIWQDSRKVIARFVGATPEELIITRNTTEAINGVAYGWQDQLSAGDVILTTLMEHHSNLVVWQQLADRVGAHLEMIKLTPEGRLDLHDLRQKLETVPVKLLSVVHVSNTTGVINPLAEITSLCRRFAAAPVRICVDGAQAVPHLPVNFSQLDVDFYAFSGHKMLGPMGIGGLLVRKSLLDQDLFKPWLFGGGMIAEVYPESTRFHPEPQERFTAGTPDVASVVGLAQACEYLTDQVGMVNAQAHDQSLVEYALQRLAELPGVEVVGPTQSLSSEQLDRIGSVAFLYQGAHAHDVAQILDSEGVAVRSGHHCTMPLHEYYRWTATTRASFQVYNTTDEIDQLVRALHKVKTVLGV